MKTFFENTIIDSINFEGYDFPENQNNFDKVQNVYKTFLSEYGWNVKRVGTQMAFKEWLQGLPSVLTVPFMNYDILNNAKTAGVKVDNEDDFLDTYFAKLTAAFFELKENL
jgi:hypothetical protein